MCVYLSRSDRRREKERKGRRRTLTRSSCCCSLSAQHVFNEHHHHHCSLSVNLEMASIVLSSLHSVRTIGCFFFWLIDRRWCVEQQEDQIAHLHQWPFLHILDRDVDISEFGTDRNDAFSPLPPCTYAPRPNLDEANENRECAYRSIQNRRLSLSLSLSLSPPLCYKYSIGCSAKEVEYIRSSIVILGSISSHFVR